MLYVDSTHSLLSLRNRRFLESLTASQFLDYTCFLELSLEFLKRLLDVFAFFLWNYDHNLNCYIV